MNRRSPNKITGANAGGRRRLPMRTRWAARPAEFVALDVENEDIDRAYVLWYALNGGD